MSKSQHAPGPRLEHLAMLNGIKTTAKKFGRRWMVGGDFDIRGSVSIIAWHKDNENGGGFYAWHKLRGAFLIYEDNASDTEIDEHLALSKSGAALAKATSA